MATPSDPPTGQLFHHIAQLRDSLLSARDDLARTEVVGEGGGGLVRVTIRGTGEVAAVRLDPAVRREDPEALAAMIFAAFDQAQQAARTLAEQRTAPLTGVGELPRPGLRRG